MGAGYCATAPASGYSRDFNGGFRSTQPGAPTGFRRSAPQGPPCGCVHPASVPSRYTVRDRIFQIANHGAGGTVCPDVAAVFGLADFHLYTTFDELQEGTLCGGALKQLAQCFELEWSNATL